MESGEINNFKINLENYNGPLDVLLDLAKSQKVNLADISITKLADQFLDFINNAQKINLDLASEYLLMATWLAYLKSKLLLPDDEEGDFKVSEIAEKLKLQLKKLELIRLLSDQLLKRKRVGYNIFFRGKPEGIRSIGNSKYNVTLYEILKSYSNFKMKRDFLTINIPKLPVFSTEEGIKLIKSLFGKLKNWKDICKIIPNEYKKNNNLKKTGLAGIFSASLELTREGNIDIMQEKLFNKILIKEKINE